MPLGGKSIAAPGKSADHLSPSRHFGNLAPQIAHVGTDYVAAASVGEEAPDLLQQFLSGDHRPPPLHAVLHSRRNSVGVRVTLPPSLDRANRPRSSDGSPTVRAFGMDIVGGPSSRFRVCSTSEQRKGLLTRVSRPILMGSESGSHRKAAGARNRVGTSSQRGSWRSQWQKS